MNVKKLGVLGGTFNPVHVGHLLMAERAAEQFGLDKLWFMPSKHPPHKESEEILPDAVRGEMVRLAIEGNDRFVFSDLEMAREGTTYTVDTLRLLKEKEPQSRIYFILGADSFFQLPTWKQPEEIAGLATILAVPRYGMADVKMERQREYLSDLYGGEFALVQMPQIGVSSKEIRTRRKRGESVRYLVPEGVYRYMEENALYR